MLLGALMHWEAAWLPRGDRDLYLHKHDLSFTFYSPLVSPTFFTPRYPHEIIILCKMAFCRRGNDSIESEIL